jgi:uncharacterized damage-inducible protein DinB
MNAEHAKAVAETVTKVWEFEFPATVKVLKAVKEDNRDYKPDEKSRTAWELATHLATADMWFLDSIINGSFDYDPDAAKQAEGQFKSVNDVVEFYRKALPAKLNEVRSLPAEKLTQTVNFFGMLQWPNVEYLGFAQNHSMHHRGQLAAYLRAMGSKVPAIYGGSADEPMQMAGQ